MALFIKELEGLNECNRTLWEAYSQSKKRGNELIDFNGIIWDRDIDPVMSTLRDCGVEQFTISTSQISIIDTLADFKKRGAVIKDLIYVKGFDGGDIPALLMKIV